MRVLSDPIRRTERGAFTAIKPFSGITSRTTLRLLTCPTVFAATAANAKKSKLRPRIVVSKPPELGHTGRKFAANLGKFEKAFSRIATCFFASFGYAWLTSRGRKPSLASIKTPIALSSPPEKSETMSTPSNFTKWPRVIGAGGERPPSLKSKSHRSPVKNPRASRSNGVKPSHT